MFSNYQSLLQIVFSIVISVGVWVGTSISLLTLPGKIPGDSGFLNLTPNLPFSQSAKYGLMIGAAHGILMALIVYWQRPQTVTGTIISSFVVTELLIAVRFIAGIFIDYFSRPVQVGKPRIDPTFENLYLLVFNFIAWFLIFTVVFSIPSVVIGLLHKFIQPSFKSI